MIAQKRIRDIISVIKQVGYEAVTLPFMNIPLFLGISHTGHIGVRYSELEEDLGRIDYTIENCGLGSRMVVSITMGGRKILSQPDRPDYYDFVLSNSDSDGYANFLNVLETEMGHIEHGVFSIQYGARVYNPYWVSK